MSYVAVKGGEQAIQQAEQLLASRRRGEPSIPALHVDQIEQQLSLAVDRVMAEGSLYDRQLASLAIKQSWGDLVEAIFLVRAYRSTLPRLYNSIPLDTCQMRIQRRISAIFKDVLGGQYLGPTFDYMHRLLDFKLMAETDPLPLSSTPSVLAPEMEVPRVIDQLARENLIQLETPQDHPIYDLTQHPLTFPVSRDARLQNLARADEGFLLSLAYSTQRGYGDSHPFAGEIRMGQVDVVICPDELGFEISIGEIVVTEVQMLNQFSDEVSPQFTQGYGLTFGHNERKAMSMALLDRSLRTEELGERLSHPAQDVEFVMYHSDNVQAQGFVQHLKLPHYIDFQAELNLLHHIRQSAREATVTANSEVTDHEHS